MLDRVWVRLAWLAAAAMLAAAAPAPRIVAIGDLHGDHAAWRAIARDAQVIDARGRWAGGRTLLVQTGDVADRGPDTLRIIRDLMRLQREAARSGGRVVALVGNHEAMNIIGDLRYVSAGEFAAFANSDSRQRRDQLFAANKAAIEAAYRTSEPAMGSDAIRRAWEAATPPGFLEHRAAWRPDGEIGRWIIANPAVLLESGTLFVHGGLSAAYAGRTIADINRSVAAALTARDNDDAAIINDPLGPLWYRGLARDDGGGTAELAVPPGAAGAAPMKGAAAPMKGAAAPVKGAAAPGAELAAVLQGHGARRMVIGHTPVLSGIALVHEGRLAQIDTGISAYYGGILSYLEIVGERLVAHVVARPVAARPAAARPAAAGARAR